MRAERAPARGRSSFVTFNHPSPGLATPARPTPPPGFVVNNHASQLPYGKSRPHRKKFTIIQHQKPRFGTPFMAGFTEKQLLNAHSHI
jgi:hypothetical protein